MHDASTTYTNVALNLDDLSTHDALSYCLFFAYITFCCEAQDIKVHMNFETVLKSFVQVTF